MQSNDIFLRLFEVIDERKTADPETSYVAKLMNRGTEKINEKVMEEASETCEAALVNDHDHLVYEICDLIFHTFVLAGHRGVELSEIRHELERRFGISGITEKKERTQ